jgi:hypothetical protein
MSKTTFVVRFGKLVVKDKPMVAPIEPVPIPPMSDSVRTALEAITRQAIAAWGVRR